MFLLIFSSNLDEFFEIRVSGLKKQLGFGRQRPGADGQYAEQTLKILHKQVRAALTEQYTPPMAAANMAAPRAQHSSLSTTSIGRLSTSAQTCMTKSDFLEMPPMAVMLSMRTPSSSKR